MNKYLDKVLENDYGILIPLFILGVIFCLFGMEVKHLITGLLAAATIITVFKNLNRFGK